jgi:hypothetical protein
MSDEIVIRPPGPEKPGYLRRVREATRIQARLRDENSVEAFDEMIDYILNTSDVTTPAGVDARDALLDLSKEQFDALFETLGGVRSKAVDPPNDA